MPHEVQLWEIGEQDQLRACAATLLDLEARLENWLADDISLLSADLIVIGRQVETSFGGIIDLLCVERSGNLVIVELKRDKTPREITAQCLDYASWVKDLSPAVIESIAADYLGTAGLKEAFRQRFGADIPEAINENHRMIVVASRVDPSSERIIKYLHTTYGVDINAATFHYFKTQAGQELLARVFLIDPRDVEYQAMSRRGATRLPNLTHEELEELAEQNGVGELYRRLVAGLRGVFKTDTTRSSLGFSAELQDTRRRILSLLPEESSAVHGLRFQVYIQRLKTLFALSDQEAVSLLPASREPWSYPGHKEPEYSGFQGYFTTAMDVDRLVRGLSTRAEGVRADP